MRIAAPIAVLALAAACGPSAPPAPDVQTREIVYQQNGTMLQGMLAWDANAEGRRPGVLVVHEWWGHDEHARAQAERLAEAGYVALAVDMYGSGRRAAHPDEAQKLMTEAMADPAVVQARFAAARTALTNDARVDPERIAAIGYCFGGAIVLGQARAGADLDAVVSFHGALETTSPAQPGAVRARVLVLTGEADPFVPPDLVEKFRAEMTAAGATFRIVTYPGVKHSFTNPQAGTHGMDQLGYDEAAANAAWQEMLGLFKEIFG
jgi:dienelactone hydrolase